MSIVLTRATKQAARYTDAGGRERCSGCRFFMPQGTCGRIVGPVSPRGWCKYYSMEAVQRWQPQGAIGFGTGPALALDFMNPSTLPAGAVFTRASTATYTDATGTMQTAATNAPRFDYNPATLALNGLLLEEQRTNLWIQSGDASQGSWGAGGNVVAAPTVTANQAVAPDGTLTAARAAFPAVAGASAVSSFTQQVTATVNPYTFSVWMKGSVGGEQIALCMTPDAANYYRTIATLTTAWQRFSVTTPNLTAAGWYCIIGTDLRDAGQTSKPAQTINIWGAQVELGGFATSYIPTAAAAVTRAADRCVIPPANMGWFASPGGSWAAEFLSIDTTTGGNRRVVGQPTAGMVTPLFRSPTNNLGQFDSVAAANTANTMAPSVVTKAASTWAPGAAKLCLNAGAIATAATLTTGYGTMVANGVAFMQTNVGVDATENMSGYMRNFRYWPRVLADAEMQSITT